MYHDVKKGSYHLTEKSRILIGFFRDIPSYKGMPIDSYILLYIKRDGKILVVERKREPAFGYTGNPAFNTEMDRFLHKTALEGLKSLGLTGKISLLLILEMLYKRKYRQIVSHACIYVFYADEIKGKAIKRNDEGELFWIDPKDLLKVEKGYENSKDIVDFFESNRWVPDCTKIISKSYKIPHK